MTHFTRGLPADVLAYMREVGDEGTTAVKVAQRFGITSQQAAGVLKKLADGGDVYNWAPEHSPRPKIWAVRSRTGASA